MKLPLSLLLLLAVTSIGAALLSCGDEEAPPASPGTEEPGSPTPDGARDLSAFMPDSAALEGLVAADDYREFPGEALFEYMNGGAEVYLALEFHRVGVREYETSIAENVYLVVEIYDMGNAADAGAIFEREFSDAESAGIAAGSALGGGTLAFHEDRFYVKIRCDDVGDTVNRLLRDTAAAVLERMAAKD